MNPVGRTLTPTVLEALTYWPRGVHAEKESLDLTAALAPFFDDLLDELPWWDGTWRIIHVERPQPREFASDDARGKNRFSEVSVPGTLGRDVGQTLPFIGRVRFEGDRLVHFRAKIADAVISPALRETGIDDPHPFGAVLSRLMDNRGVSGKELTRRTARAMSTIYSVRNGYRNPHPVLVREIARALDIPEADLAAIAGVDEDPSDAADNT